MLEMWNGTEPHMRKPEGDSHAGATRVSPQEATPTAVEGRGPVISVALGKARKPFVCHVTARAS